MIGTIVYPKGWGAYKVIEFKDGLYSIQWLSDGVVMHNFTKEHLESDTRRYPSFTEKTIFKYMKDEESRNLQE